MTERLSVLVPVRVLEGESIPEGVPELLARAHVVLLGYHVIPEQTAPGQAQMQFEARAVERLDDFEAMFEEAGATVERRLVFTHEAQKTLNRTILEHDCAAVLVPGATEPVESVLVAVRGTAGVDRLVRVVAGLFAGTGVEVTLYHVAGADETDEDAQTLLEGVVERLADGGVDESDVDLRVERGRSPLAALADASAEFDVLVVGETDPSLATYVFGLSAEQVAAQFLGPVLVVQREPPEADEA